MSGSSYTQEHQGNDLITATVLCGATNYARPFTIGIKLKLEDGWHTYWKNPGDSGIPLEINAIGAEPYRLGQIQYPTPKKFTSESGVTYGYDDSVIVLLQVFPPKNATAETPPPAFDIQIKWLVCKERCLPGEAKLHFEPGILNPSGKPFDRAVIDKWTARLPQPGIGFNFESGKISVSEHNDQVMLKAEFPGSSPGTITDFFPEDIPGYVLDHAKITITDSGFEFPLVRSESTARLSVLKGIVMVDGQGYDVTIPVRRE